jgi:uncharacterized protein (TIGR02266 family)
MSQPIFKPILCEVRAEFESRKELLRLYLSEPPHGGLMVHVRDPLTAGELVELRIQIREVRESHSLRGAVLWCRADEGGNAAGIGFLSSEVDRREALLRTPASVKANEVERQERRIPTTLKVTYKTTGDFIIDYTHNISSGGIFVGNPDPPSVGAKILFHLYPPGEKDPIYLFGKVAWQKKGRGFGVRFSADNHTSHIRLDALVRSLAVNVPEMLSSPAFEDITAQAKL